MKDGAGNVLTGLTVLDRGYTGHEHLQSVGLINMNGRIYDPKLHRFLQPDNFVQDPYNTQNFNRYGYVLNNPLKYTDFTGESWWSDNWKQVVTIGVVVVVAVVVTYATAGMASPLAASMITGAAAGFAGGVTGSALNGNSFGQVMLDGAYGGLKGGVFGAAGGYAASFAPAGILNGAAYSISTNLALNGVGNVIEGQDPFQGAGFTIAISGVTGGYQGYRSAQAQGLNTWTGKPNPSVIAKNVTNFEESAQIAYDKAVKIQQEPIDMGNTASKWDTVSSIDGKSGNSVFYKQIDPYSSAGYKSIDVTDLNHSFSKIVDNNMGSATKFTLKGGDGISRSLYQIEGASMKGVNGIFEWIVENGGNCTHRVFIPGAKITGIPNRF